MTDNELPPLPEPAPIRFEDEDGDGVHLRVYLADQMRDYARAALAQIKAREVTDAEIDGLLLDAIGFEPDTSQWVNRDDMHRIVRAAIALANKGAGS